jgi:hypothetical protein
MAPAGLVNAGFHRYEASIGAGSGGLPILYPALEQLTGRLPLTIHRALRLSSTRA